MSRRSGTQAQTSARLAKRKPASRKLAPESLMVWTTTAGLGGVARLLPPRVDSAVFVRKPEPLAAGFRVLGAEEQSADRNDSAAPRPVRRSSPRSMTCRGRLLPLGLRIRPRRRRNLFRWGTSSIGRVTRAPARLRARQSTVMVA